MSDSAKKRGQVTHPGTGCGAAIGVGGAAKGIDDATSPQHRALLDEAQVLAVPKKRPLSETRSRIEEVSRTAVADDDPPPTSDRSKGPRGACGLVRGSDVADAQLREACPSTLPRLRDVTAQGNLLFAWAALAFPLLVLSLRPWRA